MRYNGLFLLVLKGAITFMQNNEYPVAMIPYANMAPYRILGAPWGCRFVPVLPRLSIDALFKDDVVAAAVPVGGLPVLESIVEPVGTFGIAAKESSMSVLFFSRLPFEQVKQPETVHVTGESASSVRLLYLLLGYLHGFDRIPFAAAKGRVADGKLIIGDKALREIRFFMENDRPCIDYPYANVVDLAEKWFEVFNLPFVFARWVVRKDAPETVKKAILSWLDTVRERGTELGKRAIPGVAEDLDLDHDTVARYFRVIKRSLDPEDIAGQEKFIKEFQKYGRDSLFPVKEQNES